MATSSSELGSLIRKILSDIRVEVTEEIDRNFERQAFFNEAWQRRKSPAKGSGHLLIASGDLRRSISSRTDETSITFTSSLPYAAIHNEGGEIQVTAKMKRYFWRRYYETAGAFTRKKNGAPSRSKRNLSLSTEADFWKTMALMKVGSTVKIPRRRFIGASPQMEQAVKEIIEENLTQYFQENLKNIVK